MDKIENILNIIKYNDIFIVNFVVFDNSYKDYKNIAFCAEKVDRDFLTNGFFYEEKKIIPNLDSYFLNLFSSKVSLFMISDDNKIKNSLKNLNFKISFDIETEIDENLVFDICSEIFEYFKRSESGILLRYNAFKFEYIKCESNKYSISIFCEEINQIIFENCEIMNAFFIYKFIIENVLKNFSLIPYYKENSINIQNEEVNFTLNKIYKKLLFNI